MKKQLLYTAFFLSAFLANAQEPNPASALRYAIDNTMGTARYRAMSGAFGAVGGDLSSINVNPAGSAFFNSNTAGGTISNYNIKNNSNYFGSTSTDNSSTLDFNQLGASLVFLNTKENSDWKKFTIAVNYEKKNDFENNIFSRGVNPNRSISEYFTSFANGFGDLGGITLGTLQDANYRDLTFIDQQAWLGYQSYMFSPVDPGNTNDPNITNYTSTVPAGGNFYQENRISSSGYNGKLAFNVSSSYKDKLFLGMNLNVHFTDYTQTSSVYETNSGPDNAGIATLHSVVFNNDLHTYGSGFSLNLGLIAKITKDFRLGAGYESPTWYNLTDELSQSISTTFKTGPNDNPANTESSSNINPDVINIYPTYKIQTPGKITGSLAYIFGKKGLISFDYSLKDYGATKFKPENDRYYSSVNRKMAETLTAASEFRVGLEYRIKQVSLRGGYRFEESPYKDKKTVADLNGYSAGLGYSFGDSRIDLAYSYSQRDMAVSLLSSFTDAAKVNVKNNNMTLSYTFNF